MAEVADTSAHHSDAACVNRRHNLLVAHRAAWLDDRGHACVDRKLGAVGEGEESVGGKRSAVKESALACLGLLDRDAHGIHPAHLSSPNPDRGSVARNHDGVGAHMTTN